MVHWGIIGLGSIANTFASALKLVNNANLKAVASRNIDTAIAFSKNHDADISYGNYEKLANDSDVEIIYIATPHVYHYEHSKMCLERGKAVLCEKPMGMNAQQVKALCAIAKANDTLLMEGMWTAFLPNFNKLETIVKNKVYGNVKKIQADFCFVAPITNPNHRLINKSLGGGTLLDIGIYNIFACLRLLGLPETINTVAEIGTTGVDMHCTLKFIYKDNEAVLTSSFKKQSSNALHIEFENGTATLGPNYFSPAPLSISTNSGEMLQYEKHHKGSGYEFEARHFQDLFVNQKNESNIMSHKNSIELSTYLDLALKKAKIEY